MLIKIIIKAKLLQIMNQLKKKIKKKIYMKIINTKINILIKQKKKIFLQKTIILIAIS